MSEREPQSMAEYFAAEYAPQDEPPSSSAPTDERAREDDSHLYADSTPVDQPSAEAAPPPAPMEDQRFAQIQAELELLRAQNAAKEQQMIHMLQMARQSVEQTRAEEIQRSRARWERGLATGELSELDVIREREALIARHATERISALEAENTQLRTFQVQQQEAEARTQAIDLIAGEYQLTARERKYIEQLDNPYTMENIARQFQADRQEQTSAARQTLAAQRAARPVDRSTQPVAASRGEEPTSMIDYFRRVQRVPGR